MIFFKGTATLTQS